MKYDDLGKRIRTLRRQAGLTQDQLAKATGMSASYIGHIERGTRKVSLDNLNDIANVLGVTGAALMGEGAEPIPAAPADRSGYAVGNAPAADDCLNEPADDIDIRPLTSEDTRSFILRELIALLETKD